MSDHDFDYGYEELFDGAQCHKCGNGASRKRDLNACATCQNLTCTECGTDLQASLNACAECIDTSVYRIQSELERARKQLTELKAAMRQIRAIDAANVELDPIYNSSVYDDSFRAAMRSAKALGMAQGVAMGMGLELGEAA